MKKIKKIIASFFILLKQPSIINHIIESDYAWYQLLIKKHKNRKKLPVVDIMDFIQKEKVSLQTFSFLGGGSLPTDIILLTELSRKIDNCSYFEIGTWRGESVCNVAEYAKECYTLNLSENEISELGLSKRYAELHGFYSKNLQNVKHLFGDSMNFNFEKLNKKFDLIFIDGNHKYEYVKNDTKKVFEHLVHKNTIVIWHDYAYDPESPRPEVLLGILDGIPEKFKNKIYHVSNTMCAIYTPKNLKTYLPNFPSRPARKFTIEMKSILLS